MRTALPAAVSTLNQRLKEGGIANALVRQNGSSGLLIEAPGMTDDAQLRALLVPGEVEFLDTGSDGLGVGTDVSNRICISVCQPVQYPVVFTGARIEPGSVQAAADPQTGQATVTFAFMSDAQPRLATYTGQHIGEFLTIALDGKIIESATIQSAITGTGQISGVGTLKQAQNLAMFLKYGALPISLSPNTVEHVNAVK